MTKNANYSRDLIECIVSAPEPEIEKKSVKKRKNKAGPKAGPAETEAVEIIYGQGFVLP